jgi:hypothetical protein
MHAIDAPIPARRGKDIQNAVFGALSGMAPGAAGEMNRTAKRMRWYIGEFRKAHPQWQFTVRQSKAGYCRVWRVK